MKLPNTFDYWLAAIVVTTILIFDTIYLSIAQPVDASLMYAISFILAWLFLMWLLYRKQIYVKV